MMGGVYTCPYCLKSYSVKQDGDYICDCGRHFYYPPMKSSTTAKHTMDVAHIDSSSRSIKKCVKINRKYLKDGTGDNCSLAVMSFICGLLGLVFFGIFSIFALLFGILAIILIADAFNNYKGTWYAVAGNALGIIGIVFWAIYFLFLK